MSFEIFHAVAVNYQQEWLALPEGLIESFMQNVFSIHMFEVWAGMAGTIRDCADIPFFPCGNITQIITVSS